MISSQILQASIDDIKAIARVDMCICDLNGDEIVSTANMVAPDANMITSFVDSPADSQMVGNYHLLKVRDEDELEYVLVAMGFGEDTYVIGKLAVAQLEKLTVAYKDRFDRNSFFQNLLLDNFLLVDVYNRAQKLRIEVNAPRAVYLIEADPEKDAAVLEFLKNIFSTQAGDYITRVDETNIILIKAVEPRSTNEDLMHVADTILDMVNTELMINVKVAIGTVVQELKDVSKSYKEAKMALDVGKIFYEGQNAVAYSTLGIGRLIYQLPVNLCRMFIDEIFGNGYLDQIDDETLETINKFFENNLNVSETSRQLFMHRNTLVYRIEKLQKNTGLDIRKFDDAMTLKIALMVVSYMKYQEEQDN
ncbi:MAG: helix-turn-helix domain-containing protein [Lachnospiraceae bacterium]|nr:helix-turn-helix domain-containing protein [Lachnospiraceae bacterium]